MTESTFTKTIFLATTRETVWAYLTEKDKLALWFHPAESDLIEGHDYALVDSTTSGSAEKLCWGKVLKMNKPASMQWSFTVQPLNGAMTTVNWTLEESSGGTRLTLQHDGIGAAAGEAALGLILALDKGWDEHLGKLRQTVPVSTELQNAGCAEHS